MKKIVFVAAAAGLMSLAACNHSNTDMQNNTADAMADNLEMQADNYDDMADATNNAAAENMYENMEQNTEAAADAIEQNH